MTRTSGLDHQLDPLRCKGWRTVLIVTDLGELVGYGIGTVWSSADIFDEDDVDLH
jgi:hypothetical protein